MYLELNDGESVTIAKNHDKKHKINRHYYTIIRTGDHLGVREFGDNMKVETKNFNKDNEAESFETVKKSQKEKVSQTHPKEKGCIDPLKGVAY